jgi:hypothetical protein
VWLSAYVYVCVVCACLCAGALTASHVPWLATHGAQQRPSYVRLRTLGTHTLVSRAVRVLEEMAGWLPQADDALPSSHLPLSGLQRHSMQGREAPELLRAAPWVWHSAWQQVCMVVGDSRGGEGRGGEGRGGEGRRGEGRGGEGGPERTWSKHARMYAWTHPAVQLGSRQCCR